MTRVLVPNDPVKQRKRRLGQARHCYNLANSYDDARVKQGLSAIGKSYEAMASSVVDGEPVRRLMHDGSQASPQQMQRLSCLGTLAGVPDSGATRPQSRPRARQIPIRKATPAMAEVRNTSLGVTAQVLFWSVPEPTVPSRERLKRTDFATLAEPVDVLLEARRYLRLYSYTLLQAFADFLPDHPAVDVINIDRVAHDGTSLFR